MTDDHRPDGPDGLLAGRIEGISVPDLLWALSSGRRTGTLALRRDDVEKTVYLERGRILFATSSDPDDRLGELLLREGDIRLDDLEEALCNLHTGKRLGTLLVEAGRLSPGRLVDAVLAQVHGIVLDLFDWDEGEYRFSEGELPTEEVITLGARSEELLLQGIRRVRSFARIRQSVGPLRTVYGLTDTWRETLTGLGVTEGERRIAVVLERGDATVDTLCAEVYLSNFEVYQALWAFKVIGAVAERDGSIESRDDAAHEGSLSRRDFAELLTALARDGATGVLHVARGPRERTFHLDAGRCVFATSNDIDDGLVAYLLRRGVISLRHREEIAKRLLSNRRVGTILSDLGVITDDELAPMVRQQLTEIVYDTFRFNDGEWAFVPGELPSVETIALEVSVPALVAGGLRRVRSWGRVFRGCGGLDTTLELTADYLGVLDAIGAGPDEWAVVTALKSPRTPRAVCRAVPGPDHRVCQLLWILRVLGAVRVAEQPVERPAEQPADAPPPLELAEPESGVEPFESDVVPADETPAALELDDAPAPAPVDDDRAVVEDDEPAPIPVGLDDATAVAMDEPPTPIPVELDDRATPVAFDGDGAPIDDDDEPWQPVEVRTASPEATQSLDRAAVEAALRGPVDGTDPGRAATDELAPEATQVLDRAAVDAALRGDAEVREAPEVPVANAAGDDDGADAPTDGDTDDRDVAIRTMRVDPVDVEAVASSPWQPPEDLDRIIERFNAVQRVLYRAIRAEVGAGAVNLIRSCCGQVDDGGAALADAELQADGTWDRESLRRGVEAQRLDDPWSTYQSLIDREIDLLRMHIGEARAAELEQQVERLEAQDARA